MFNLGIKEKVYSFVKKDEGSTYGYYQGTNNKWNKFCWNLLNPGRILDRMYGKTIGKKKFNHNLYKNNDKFDFKKIFDDFCENGCVVIDNYFDEKTVNTFLNDYRNDIELFKTTLSKNIERKEFTKHLELKNSLINLWLDDNLINLLKNFTKGKIYARDYPIMNFHNNWEDNIPTKVKSQKNRSSYADDWHIDHANLINVHVILEDIKEDDLCMEFIPKSNKNFNLPHLYSDEAVEKIKPFEIKKCIGKKGTVYIHYGNTLHRLKPVKNSSRLLFKAEFSPSTNILLNYDKIASSLKENFDLEKLDSNRKEILRGLYPKTYGKGFTIIKNDLIQTRSKSI